MSYNNNSCLAALDPGWSGWMVSGKNTHSLRPYLCGHRSSSWARLMGSIWSRSRAVCLLVVGSDTPFQQPHWATVTNSSQSQFKWHPTQQIILSMHWVERMSAGWNSIGQHPISATVVTYDIKIYTYRNSCQVLLLLLTCNLFYNSKASCWYTVTTDRPSGQAEVPGSSLESKQSQ